MALSWTAAVKYIGGCEWKYSIGYIAFSKLFVG